MDFTPTNSNFVNKVSIEQISRYMKVVYQMKKKKIRGLEIISIRILIKLKF